MENNTTWEERFEDILCSTFTHSCSVGTVKGVRQEYFDGYKEKVKAFIAAELTAARAKARAEAVKEAIAVVESKKDWPEPVEGAGEQIGPLAGVGMYMQYDADRKRHREELSEIIGQLTVLVGKTKDQ